MAYLQQQRHQQSRDEVIIRGESLEIDMNHSEQEERTQPVSLSGVGCPSASASKTQSSNGSNSSSSSIREAQPCGGVGGCNDDRSSSSMGSDSSSSSSGATMIAPRVPADAAIPSSSSSLLPPPAGYAPLSVATSSRPSASLPPLPMANHHHHHSHYPSPQPHPHSHSHHPQGEASDLGDRMWRDKLSIQDNGRWEKLLWIYAGNQTFKIEGEEMERTGAAGITDLPTAKKFVLTYVSMKTGRDLHSLHNQNRVDFHTTGTEYGKLVPFLRMEKRQQIVLRPTMKPLHGAK